MDRAVISLLTATQLTACFGAFMAYQWGIASAAPFLTARSGAPTIMLMAIPPIYLANAYVIAIWQSDPKTKYCGFPAFLGAGDDGPLLQARWQRISIVITLILPLLWLGYFWIEFHQHQAWTNGIGPAQQVGLYDFTLPFPAALTEWNAHRYGDIGQHSYQGDDFSRRSVSYLPGYQPVLLMAPLSLAALLCAVRLCKTHLALKKRAQDLTD